MKRKRQLSAFVLFLCAAGISAELEMVDFTKFPNDAALRSEVAGLQAKESMFKYWTSDDFWKFSQTRSQVADSVAAVLGHVENLIKGGSPGIDLKLYRAMLMHYLYNLERGEYHDTLIAAVDELKKEFPGDFRPSWVLGLHLSQTELSREAMDEFQSVLDRFPREKLAPAFWDNYAMAASMCIMPFHAIAAIETAVELRGSFTPESKDLYSRLKKAMKRPEDAPDLKDTDVLRSEKVGDDYEILARPLGMRFPMRASWTVKAFAFKDATFFFGVESEGIRSAKGNEIQYSIMFVTQAHSKMEYEDFKTWLVKPAKDSSKTALEGIDPRWEVYELRDPEVYKEMGGMHGYAAFLRAGEPKFRGLVTERLGSRPNQGDGGVSYYMLKDMLIRYDGDIYSMIILDTCEDIFQKSREDFLEFIRGMAIE